jgi:Zn-dependent protease
MNFLGGSFPIGRLFGITVRVHFLFVLWIGYTLFTAGPNLKSEALFLGMLFGIVLVHEFGHCLGARSVGGDARDILMWPLGGLAYAHAPMRPWPQFVTVASGPFVNVIFCLLSAAVLFAASGGRVLPGINPLQPGYFLFGSGPIEPPPWFFYAATFYRVNLFLLAFNLLPIYPLDGGQLFHTILWPFLGLQRATIVACTVGLAGAIGFGLWGLGGAGREMLVFIAIFGGMTCWQRLQMARHGMLIEDSQFDSYAGPSHDPRPWWQRIFRTSGGRRRALRDSYGPVNPNPGGWEARQQRLREEETELDRILRKVSEHGVQSLSYVERQTLERITRERRDREQQFERDTRV